MLKAYLAVLILSVALMVSACGKDSKEADKKPPPRTASVLVANSTTQDIPVTLSAIGEVEASSTISVRPQVGGQVLKVHFSEGQEVRKGDLLVTIDPRPYEIAVKQAEALLARDTAQFENAAGDANRYKELLADGFVSHSQYDQARTGAATFEAALKSDHAAVERARLDLSYCYIRAPKSGRTGDLLVHEGNLVKANDDKALVVIESIEPVYVEFALPEAQLAILRDKLRSGGLNATVSSQDGSIEPVEGRISFLDNAVDRATGTIKMKAVFKNGDRTLWPGQFVNVMLTLSKRTGAVVVPSEAVQTGQTGTYVYVIKPDMTAGLKPVATGPSYEGKTVIDKGIGPAERVVTDGHLRLTPGMKVTIKGEGAPVAPEQQPRDGQPK